jgi:hypothetical protein
MMEGLELPKNLELPTKPDGLHFVALGGIWLDEICTPGKETLYDVPGGSVAFGEQSTSRIDSCLPRLTGWI